MRWILAFLAAISTLMAQPQAYPLESVRVKGNERIAPEKIIALSGLKIGAAVTKADFDGARARLLATGAFESVGYDYKPSASKTGFDADFEVIEVQQVFPYHFEDLPVADDVLRTALKKQEPILGDQIPASKEVLDRYIAVIQKIAGDNIKVTAKVATDAPGETAIVFRPNTPRPQIAEVKFTGNEVLPASVLMRTLAGVAIGIGFSETTFRTMLDSSIRPLYEARGRLRVAFPKITTENSMQADGVVVITAISEGPSYSLGLVKVAGAAPQETTDLLRAANVQPNDVANFDEVKAGMDRVLGRLRTRGYIRASAHVDRAVDDQAHKVDVTIAVEPGPQFTMGKLTIAGLDVTAEPEIRKVWTLKTGAPFQPDYPDAFLNDLRAQNVFENLGKTKAESTIDEKTHVVDVKLTFTAAPPDPKEGQRKKGPGMPA